MRADRRFSCERMGPVVRQIARGSSGLLLLGLLSSGLSSATAAAGAGTTAPADARSAFDRGWAAFERQDFDAAVEAFQTALDAGLDHAVVHYDLGNAHFKRGDLGRAIASYERALRRDPRLAEARANLQRARAQIRDVELSSHLPPPVLRPLHAVYAALSENEWWVVALVLWWSLAFVAGLRPWWPPAREWWRRGAPVAAAGLAVAIGCAAMHHHREVSTTTAVVVAEEAEVRSGPGSDYNLVFRVHEGLSARVRERRDGWVRIDLGGELVGWLPVAEIETL